MLPCSGLWGLLSSAAFGVDDFQLSRIFRVTRTEYPGPIQFKEQNYVRNTVHIGANINYISNVIGNTEMNLATRKLDKLYYA